MATTEILALAYSGCETDQDHLARFNKPEGAPIEISGGDNATRQINGLIEPGFDCHRLVAVEV